MPYDLITAAILLSGFGKENNSVKKLFSVLLSAITAAVCVSAMPVSAAEADARSYAAAANSYSDPYLSSFAEEVAYLVNKERLANGLSELRMVPELNEAAQTRAEELVISFDHIRPDGSSSSSVIKQYGWRLSAVGENIAAGQPDPAFVMDRWMNSKGHRSNILSPDFQYIGVGVVSAKGAEYSMYWTQLFIKSGDVTDSYLPEKPVRSGDANCDYKMSIADAVAILQHIGNRDKYSLTEDGMENADVDGVVGVTANDALIIQQVDAGIYTVNDLPLAPA